MHDDNSKNLYGLIDKVLDKSLSADHLNIICNMIEKKEKNDKTMLFMDDFLSLSNEIKTIIKSKTAIVSRNGQDHKYSYLSIDDITQYIKPLLNKYGFILYFTTIHQTQIGIHQNQIGYLSITCVLMHKTGEKLEVNGIFPYDTTRANKLHAIGSAKTYGRKYLIYDLLGISGMEKDDDGAAGPIAPNHFDNNEIIPINNDTYYAENKYSLEELMNLTCTSEEKILQYFKVESMQYLTGDQLDFLKRTLLNRLMSTNNETKN